MITPFDIFPIDTWILLATVFFLTRYYVHKKWQVLKRLNIPHDPPSLINWGNSRSKLANPYLFFQRDFEMMKKYGRVYGVYNGLTPKIGISDPKVLKQILIKESHVFPDREKRFCYVSGKVMGAGLTKVSGKRWKRIRHTLSPTFSTSKLKEMFGTVAQCTDRMMLNLNDVIQESNGVFDTHEIFGNLSLDVVCSAAFGVNVHCQEKGQEEQKIVKMAKKFFNRTYSKNLTIFLFDTFPWAERVAGFFNYSMFASDCVNYFATLTNKVIQTKKSMPEKKGTDILHHMLESEISEEEAKHKTKGLTRMEITGNSVLMMTGSYETTLGAMIFLAYNLAWHKDVQALARKEVKSATNHHGGLTYEAVNDMKYLTQCLNETLRLYPPSVRSSRQCDKKITIDGITILQGMVVDIPTYGLARDESYWKDPLEFRPERMEDMNQVDPMMFQPFGAGPRNCIGMRFAIMEIKMIFAQLLLNFELEVCPNTPKPPVDIIFKFSLKPIADIYLKVIPIETRQNSE